MNEGEKLTVAGIPMRCARSPVIRRVTSSTRPGDDAAVVLGGDVLFRGSVGRTDFPGGSFEQLTAGIKRKLWTLSPETVVYPGHGPVTTIGHEKRTNPYVGDGAREKKNGPLTHADLRPLIAADQNQDSIYVLSAENSSPKSAFISGPLLSFA